MFLIIPDVLSLLSRSPAINIFMHVHAHTLKKFPVGSRQMLMRPVLRHMEELGFLWCVSHSGPLPPLYVLVTTLLNHILKTKWEGIPQKWKRRKSRDSSRCSGSNYLTLTPGKEDLNWTKWLDIRFLSRESRTGCWCERLGFGKLRTYVFFVVVLLF